MPQAPSAAGLSPPCSDLSGPLATPTCTPVQKKTKRLATKRCREPYSFCWFKEKTLVVSPTAQSDAAASRGSAIETVALTFHITKHPCLFPHRARMASCGGREFLQLREPAATRIAAEEASAISDTEKERGKKNTQTHRHRHTHTDTHTQTHRHTHRHTDTHTQTHTHRHTHTSPSAPTSGALKCSYENCSG